VRESSQESHLLSSDIGNHLWKMACSCFDNIFCWSYFSGIEIVKPILGLLSQDWASLIIRLAQSCV
jgi:hypothetical protein